MRDLINHRANRLFPELLFAICLFLATCICSLGYAQHNIKFTHLNTDNGLSQNNVMSMLKDKHGFMWFGTEEGLNRYDGYQFRVYSHDPKNKRSICDNNITSLLEDRTGTLWIATNNGLSRYNSDSDSFISYKADAGTNSISSNAVTSLAEDHLGNLWVGTYDGLNILDRKTNAFHKFAARPAQAEGLSSDQITAVYEDRQHRVWIGTRDGLNRFDRKNNRFTKYQHLEDDPTSLSNNYVSAILEDDKGSLWIGTNGGGLNKYNPAAQSFHTYHRGLKTTGNLSSNTNFFTSSRAAGIFVGRNRTRY